MSQPLLAINDLQIAFGTHRVLHKIRARIPKGKVVAIVGESGSGKSLTALSILRLLPENAVISGNINFAEKEVKRDLLQLNNADIRELRGNKIAMIFQEPMTSLNPVLRCGRQVMEAIMTHAPIAKEAARKKVLSLFEKVQLPEPEKLFYKYPFEISGGQKQRVMIAMAMSSEPELLICDEPTTALDVLVQKDILQLIKNLQSTHDMSVLFISHDLNVVADIADEIIVLYKGAIVEQGTTHIIFTQPQHPYTKALLACHPELYSKNERLPVVSDFLENKEVRIKKNTEPLRVSNEIILSVKNISVRYAIKKDFQGKVTQYNNAVSNVSFEVRKGETFGIVGGSGCGKTTLGRSIIGLVQPFEGDIRYKQQHLLKLSTKDKRKLATQIQFIFQDPYSALNPRLKIGDAIAEPLYQHEIYPKKEVKKEVEKWLEKVGLPGNYYNRYPHEFSGGQRQRIVIARALAMNPEFVICDESVSALDVSVQAQVLNLLNDLKRELGFTSIFISHDLAVIKYVCDRIMVMNDGRVVELGETHEIYERPKTAYTRSLLSALPKRTI